MHRLYRRYSSVVERALRKRTVVGSIPTGGSFVIAQAAEGMLEREAVIQRGPSAPFVSPL